MSETKMQPKGKTPRRLRTVAAVLLATAAVAGAAVQAESCGRPGFGAGGPAPRLFAAPGVGRGALPYMSGAGFWRSEFSEEAKLAYLRGTAVGLSHYRRLPRSVRRSVERLGWNEYYRLSLKARLDEDRFFKEAAIYMDAKAAAQPERPLWSLAAESMIEVLELRAAERSL